MQLTDCARQLPEEIWELFQPLLPPVVWCGNGRPPASNYACLHAVFYVLVSGIAWRMLPKGFPSYKTVQRRLQVWLQLEPSGRRGSSWRNALKPGTASTGTRSASTARKRRQKMGRTDGAEASGSGEMWHRRTPRV
jgi:transposase